MKALTCPKKLFAVSILLMLLNLLFAIATYAQPTPLDSWNSVTAEISLGKKTDISISQLVSFTPSSNFEVNFAQTSLALQYSINKNFTLKAGDQLNFIPGSSRAFRNRVFGRLSTDYKVGRYLKAEHGLQVELHSNEYRYAQRMIFINKLRTRKRYTALRVRPSLSYWLYYNMGGSPLDYYDAAGYSVISQTPDGFHRGRMYVSLNAKVSKSIGLSMYYMRQNEFNLLSGEFRRINVMEPSTGKINRPYNNGQVIGLSLHFEMEKND